MHGIERIRNTSTSPEAEGGISRVVVRYNDGRTATFVPDAGAEFFNEDDMLELQRVLVRAASAAEWAEVIGREE